MGPRHDLSFCACTTAWLASELLVSMGPCPHVWFVHAKQRLLDRHKKSPWVPDLTCRFVPAITAWFAPEWQAYMGSSPHLCVFLMQNSDYRTRLTSLHGSHTSSVVLSTHKSVLSTRIKRLYGFQPSPVVLCMQSSDFRARITSLYGS